MSVTPRSFGVADRPQYPILTSQSQNGPRGAVQACRLRCPTTRRGDGPVGPRRHAPGASRAGGAELLAPPDVLPPAGLPGDEASRILGSGGPGRRPPGARGRAVRTPYELAVPEPGRSVPQNGCEETGTNPF